MNKIIFIWLLLSFQNIFCYSQNNLNVSGEMYTVSEINGVYYVNNQETHKRVYLDINDQKKLSKCETSIGTVRGKTDVLKNCQKSSDHPASNRFCKSFVRSIHALIWESPSESDTDMAMANWDIKDFSTNVIDENNLISKIAISLNIPKNKIVILKNVNENDSITWRFIQTKQNNDFELVKNFYAYADKYQQSQKIELYDDHFRTFDNITRCSLLMHEAELVADIEYKIQAPGPIDEGIQENLKNILAAFKEINMDATKYSVKKLIVVGAYIGHTFQQSLDLRSDDIGNTVLAIYSSLFDAEFNLRKTVDYESYRKAMNIKSIEVIIPGKLRAVAPE